MSKSYDSKDVRVLGEIENIRLNPGMYIGHTEHPTHLMEECLDNALDEMFAGSGTEIDLYIDPEANEWMCSDNARGIPIDGDIPELICTKLFSGSKFQDEKSAYGISSGLHGVGLVAVNALSDYMYVEIYRDGKHAEYTFKDSKLVDKQITKHKGEKPFSTLICFYPSKKIFNNVEPDFERLRKRLELASIRFPDSIFKLNGEKINISLDEYFKKQCLDKSDKETTDNIIIEVKNGNEELLIDLCYSLTGKLMPKFQSSVNLIDVEGGTHIDKIQRSLMGTFSKHIKKYEFKLQDCFIGLRCYIQIMLNKPQFSGQSKDRLSVTKESLSKLFALFEKELKKYFLDRPDYLDERLEAFKDYRLRMSSKKLKVNRRKRSSTKLTKLRDCRDREGAELYITEGESAAGSLINCRDNKIHAILPLKGKIKNIAKHKEILKNKEIQEIIQAIGTGLPPDFDIKYIRYDKIIVLADADPNGKHIVVLVLAALAGLVPEVINQGYVYVCETPLYAINDGKEFTPIWTEKELEKYRKTNKRITRFKGLGEFNPEQLKTFTVDKKNRKLIKIEESKDMKYIMSLLEDRDKKRELLNSN